MGDGQNVRGRTILYNHQGLIITIVLSQIGIYIQACRIVTRVSVPFTESHYHGNGEKPNTELADNSPLSAGVGGEEEESAYAKFVSNNLLINLYLG